MADDAVADHELRPAGLFSPDFRARAIEAFGSDGAWLLTSIIWYGWRAHYDLACALSSGALPELGDEARTVALDQDFQIVKDLQIQASLFAAAEQFATLMRAVRRHTKGEEPFFEAYVGAPLRFDELIGGIGDISRYEVVEMLGDPRLHKSSGQKVPLGLQDPATVETVDVGGLHVPRQVIDEHVERNIVDVTSELIELVMQNIAQLRQFVDEPDPLSDVEVVPRPLRDVDNAFRHGLRVLFHECVPETRRFRVGAVLEEAGEFSVDLYMPQRKGREKIRFATVSCTTERTTGHISALRELSTRTGQVARGFAGKQLFGDARWLMAASTMSLPETYAGTCTDPRHRSLL